jgi:hypothetical protein
MGTAGVRAAPQADKLILPGRASPVWHFNIQEDSVVQLWRRRGCLAQ